MKKVLIMFVLLIMSGALFAEAATNNDYCIMPVFTNETHKPNILIDMDFSGSMQFPAYLPNNFDNPGSGYSGTVADCRSDNISSTQNTSYKYDLNRNYFGNFDNTKYYQSVASSLEINNACATDPLRVGLSTSCISGNILNWLTSTRIDVARKALTGGINNTGSGATVLYSQGSAYVVNDSFTNCTFTITASTTTNRRLTVTNLAPGTCILNGISAQNIQAKYAEYTVEGIVQKFWNYANFQFMVFSSNYGSYNRQGEVKTAKDAPLATVVASINNELPYGGTFTGESLYEAEDYYGQHNNNPYENNNAYIGITSALKDPYYDAAPGGDTPIYCRKTYILLISDGAWNGAVDPIRPARNMRINDMRVEAGMDGRQNVTTYAIYAFGQSDPTGRNAMIATAMFGGFDFTSTDLWPYPYTNWPATNSLAMTFPLPQCNPSGTWNNECSEWEKSPAPHTGLPYNFFEAEDGDQLVAALEAAIYEMLRRASSGSGVAMIGSSEGSGGNMLQGLFYPKKGFNNVEVAWIGELKDLWYFLDPYILRSSVREDTDSNNRLSISKDYVLKYTWNETEQKTYVKKYQDNTPATQDPRLPPVLNLVEETEHDGIKALWEAGIELHHRSLDDRRIFTTIDSSTLVPFTKAYDVSLMPFMQTATTTDTDNIIDYVRGIDIPTFRNRTVMAARRGEATAQSGTWKLGDIVSSTARIMSSEPLNDYHHPTPNGYGDRSYAAYTKMLNYKNRGMVFVGANDGMLHAFELGNLRQIDSADEKAELNPNAMGKENWAFIPKSALPYLTYLKDPLYRHIFTVDGNLTLADVTFEGPTADKKLDGSTWRTVLIGSMGIGGASRNKVVGTPQCPSGSRCVETPTVGVGLSSYFAFEVGQDQTAPQLLWEFTHPKLGFSTTGAAIVKTNAGTDDHKLNGNWFAVIASGPTGPIDTTENQFKADSDQNLHIFVLDLRNGTPLRVIDTGISRAFGGAMGYATVDVDRWKFSGTGWYSDDVLYMGFNRFDAAANRWKGGVIRIIPGTWSWSIVVNDTDVADLGPITSAVTRIQDSTNHDLWLYFGTGRYNYRLRNGTVDDPTKQQYLYGVKESSSCYRSDDTFNPACNARGAVAWRHPLDAESTDLWADRCITTPLTAPNGNVFFISFAPSKDVCQKGGTSTLHIMKYDTGVVLAETSSKIIVMLGGGIIADVNVSGTIGTGGPPSVFGGGGIFAPTGMKKILHIKER